ncbi:23S rRNA (guanosine2251-2'-O)-methyltransferase [Alkalibaculum bacchi]|uniref:23S rRNA (Guanosine2251-2'-O)-methyltransferase n=1 Tax=Alkalibaculum bacchi TaxID=645887 RepID=A0A366IBB0_9FIRM|nr:23S rRNA (guanosine(2251)-2'-O)-methyltransferase RlmB [Alkalibaculum bacchi]RBP67381.1 23S rRNA (guanosine2251-2'-O)-methyltransferase [Alkalibaculum bacchi]
MNTNKPLKGTRQIEGKNPIVEALKSDVNIEKIMVAKGRRETGAQELFELAKEKKIKIQQVDRKKLDFTSKTGNHQGIIAIASEYEYAEIEDILEGAKVKGESPLVVILDKITDPHNFGAIIRTANACGVHGIIIPKNRSVDISPIAIKASAGAIEHTPICKVTNLTQTIKELKEKGFWIAGADMEGQKYYESDFKGSMAIVIGNEGEGISRLVKDECDFLVSIPMYGEIESLNASVATGILLSEAAKQRN